MGAIVKFHSKQTSNTTMKRVAIDIDSLVPHYVSGTLSGIGRTTMELVSALDALESMPVDIVLYSQNMKGIGVNNLHTSFEKHHLYLPYRNNVNKVISHFPIREMITHADLYHIPHNFDFVHRPDRCVVTLHDAMFFTCPQEAFNFDFARKHYPTLAKQARGIITCSEASKRDIVRYMDIDADKIAVIPWGINHTIFHPCEVESTHEDYFLSVSCSIGRKNTPTLLQAYSLFLQKLSTSERQQAHQLLLVWNHAGIEVQQLIQQLHIADKVTILSNITDSALARLYQEATCTFFPSRYEGFGLPIIESMACGTPVVTCNNSSLPEVGGTAAIYVAPDEAEGMASIMLQFEQHSLQKQQYSNACIRQAQHFSWQQCAQQTVDFYLQCLA